MLILGGDDGELPGVEHNLVCMRLPACELPHDGSARREQLRFGRLPGSDDRGAADAERENDAGAEDNR